MSRIISFASGNFWSWKDSKDRNGLLSYMKNLKVDGIEITFSSKEELYASKFSAANEKWLTKLNYVTIHAPFHLSRDADNEQEVIRQLKIISALYTRINAKNVIIHPQDLPAPRILNMFPFKVSTENLAKKKNITIADFRKIFKKYPKVNLCLDVAHAYLWSKDETGKLVNAFKNRISQIHFSGTYRKRDHQSIRIVTKNFLSSIEPIFSLKCPIVIEGDIRPKNLQFSRDEVEFIKNMFRT
ncbi:MAG: hypothetical protein PHW01_02210 [Patescibacteria group bacterium]|nr:hypothetical protein [Patescibacteria group bacterium]